MTHPVRSFTLLCRQCGSDHVTTSHELHAFIPLWAFLNWLTTSNVREVKRYECLECGQTATEIVG